MSLTILQTVTDASLREQEKLEQFAVEQASAGTPWLDE